MPKVWKNGINDTAMMTKKGAESRYWDQVHRRTAEGGDAFDQLLAEQYRRIHFGLISRWADIEASRLILKTDLFAEAVQPARAFLWDLLRGKSGAVGIDISMETTSAALARTVQQSPDSSAQFVTCDVRELPFARDSFDLIISDSTLDHFRQKGDIDTALAELARVLKPGGIMVITMDNKGNITEPIFRLWILLGLAPFFIGKTYGIGELKQELVKVGLQVVDTTAIIHNPRFFARRLVALLRRVEPVRLDGAIRRALSLLDGLERWRMKYLTAQFIAAKAVKPPTCL